MRIYENGKIIAENLVNINKNSFVQDYSFKLKAAKKGIHRYEIVLSPLENELTIKNNKLNVLESTSKYDHFAPNSHRTYFYFLQQSASPWLEGATTLRGISCILYQMSSVPLLLNTEYPVDHRRYSIRCL